jgi:predicted metalloprotease with PDZ domain
MQRIKRYFPAVFFLILFFGPRLACGQAGALDIDYTVTLSDTAKQQFHITTDIKNINQPRLDLSLPVWTPGWYTVENYGKNVLRFTVTDEKGNRLPTRMSRKQTWNIDTKGIKQIRVEYDYSATVLALNQAKITNDFAFFTGIEIFLEPLGHRNTPSTVRFQIPNGWKLISALKETSDPMVFAADNYDTLVDSPTQMGAFDVTQFEVEGKPHYFVATPAGTFNKEKSAKFVDMLGKTIRKIYRLLFLHAAGIERKRCSRAFEFIRSLRPARRFCDAGNDHRHGVARIFSSLERQTFSPGRDVAVRLFT